MQNKKEKVYQKTDILPYIREHIEYIYNKLIIWENDQNKIDEDHKMDYYPKQIFLFNFISIEYINPYTVKKSDKSRLYIKFSTFFNNNYIFNTSFTKKTRDNILFVIQTDYNNYKLQQPATITVSVNKHYTKNYWNQLENRHIMLLSFAVIQYSYLISIIFNYYQYIIPENIHVYCIKDEVINKILRPNQLNENYITYLFHEEKFSITSNPYLYKNTEIPIPSFILAVIIGANKLEDVLMHKRKNGKPPRDINSEQIHDTTITNVIQSLENMIQPPSIGDIQDKNLEISLFNIINPDAIIDTSYNLSQINNNSTPDMSHITNAQEFDELDELFNKSDNEEDSKIFEITF